MRFGVLDRYALNDDEVRAVCSGQAEVACIQWRCARVAGTDSVPLLHWGVVLCALARL